MTELAVICWNTIHTQAAVEHVTSGGAQVREEHLARLSRPVTTTSTSAAATTHRPHPTPAWPTTTHLHHLKPLRFVRLIRRRLPGGFRLDGDRMELSHCGVESADRLHVVGLRHLACGHIVGDPPADLLELSQCVAQCQPGLPREEHFVGAEPAPFGFATGFVGTLAMTWAAVSARPSPPPSGWHHVAAPLTMRADFHHSDVRGPTVLPLLIGG